MSVSRLHKFQPMWALDLHHEARARTPVVNRPRVLLFAGVEINAVVVGIVGAGIDGESTILLQLSQTPSRQQATQIAKSSPCESLGDALG